MTQPLIALAALAVLVGAPPREAPEPKRSVALAPLMGRWYEILRTPNAQQHNCHGAYQSRHTFATVLLMGGINPAYIAKQLGHASLAMVFKVYAKWINRADKGGEAAKANAVIGVQLSPNCPRKGEAI